MKTIYVHGSYRGNNFGDYLLFKIINDAICENEYDTVYDHVSLMYQDLNPIKVRSILGAIICSDAVVCAGGGFLGEPRIKDHYWNFRCLYFHIGPLLLAAFLRKPIAIIGTEVGDLSSKLLCMLLRFVLKRAHIVSVRNTESLIFVEKLVPNISAEVHPDWVMTSRFSKSFDIDCSSAEKTERKTIFLHTMNSNEIKLLEICRGINKFFESNDNIDVIVGTDHDTESHKKAVEFLLKHLDKKHVLFHEYGNNPYDLVEVLNRVDYIITTKLHVGICGIRMGKRVMALPCHPKIRKFYEYINYDSRMILDFMDVSENKVLNLLEYAVKYFKSFSNEQLIRDADVNEMLLHDYLHKISDKLSK